MELKDFVSQTLVQIVQGVTEAQQQVAEQALVSPAVISKHDHAADLGFINTQNGQAQVVKFDVAVSASKDKGGKASGGIKVLSVSLGGEATTADTQSSVSHVQFSVPVVLPGGEQSTAGPPSPMPARKTSK